MSEPETSLGPVVSVVVATYRRPERLAGLLGALAAQDLDPDAFEVIVVDDGTGGTAYHDAFATSTRPRHCTLVRQPDNAGPAAARNRGAGMARAALLAFTDDDCLPAPGWLRAGVAALEHAGCGLVQGRTVAERALDGRDLQDWWSWREIDGPGHYYEACNIFYRRSAFEAAGGFDEGLAWWGEDTALGWSVVDAGWTPGYAPDAVVHHEVARRGFGWFVGNGLRSRHVVALAADHPGFRSAAFWRPWAHTSDDALFALAVVGGVASLRWRPAVAAVVPYVVARRPSLRRRSFARLCLQIPMVDAARAVGFAVGSIEHRMVVV